MLLSIVQAEYSIAGVKEVPAIGEFFLCEDKPKLFPGGVYGVYGFFVELTPEEALSFYDEAKDRNALFVGSSDNFKPIKDNFYPIYWGKDKSIGKRPYEHLKNPQGTGAIRLSTYSSLKGKRVHSLAVVVDDNERLENHLQNKYPHLLLTKTAQHIAI